MMAWEKCGVQCAASTAAALLALVCGSGSSAAEPDAQPAVTSEQLEDMSRASRADRSEAEEMEGAVQANDASQAGQGRVAQSPRSQPTAGVDRLELDTTVVTGNRELPKVLYIVPWKKADLGELPAQPFNTLLDEVLEPVDRDVFRREVTYFDAVASGADANQSTSAPQR
jgi:hypothetical protein